MRGTRCWRAVGSALLLAATATACRPATPAGPAFTDRVWQVATSSGVEPGMLYVFLGDGTLLIASAHGTPSLGRWESAGTGIVLVEEGLRHPADVLVSTRDTLSIRVHSPGEPLNITLVPAK